MAAGFAQCAAGTVLISGLGCVHREAGAPVWERSRSAHGRMAFSEVTMVLDKDKGNVTMAADISLDHANQLLRGVTELQILGEVTLSKSLYVGPNAENHGTDITVTSGKTRSTTFCPSSLEAVCGLLGLIVIVIILFKCGFLKRKNYLFFYLERFLL